MTEISQWYHDHPEVWVEEEFLPRCIKLTMIMDNDLQGFRATREIKYIELIHSKMDLMELTLNGMRDQLIKVEELKRKRDDEISKQEGRK